MTVNTTGLTSEKSKMYVWCTDNAISSAKQGFKMKMFFIHKVFLNKMDGLRLAIGLSN